MNQLKQIDEVLKVEWWVKELEARNKHLEDELEGAHAERRAVDDEVKELEARNKHLEDELEGARAVRRAVDDEVKAAAAALVLATAASAEAARFLRETTAASASGKSHLYRRMVG